MKNFQNTSTLPNRYNTVVKEGFVRKNKLRKIFSEIYDENQSVSKLKPPQISFILLFDLSMNSETVP